MHIISRKHLLEFGSEHPDAEEPLDRWYRIVKRTDFGTFSELRKTFPATDQVSKLPVFNIAGNKYRLIAFIVYQRKRIYVREILTHEDDNKGKWKKL